MNIAQQPFGTTAEGKAVDLYTLDNGRGVKVSIMTYGCILTAVEVPDRNGKSANVTLNLDTLKDYLAGHPMFGAVYNMMNNEDYYGTSISDQDKFSPGWLKDYAEFAGKQFVPFSVTGFQRRRQAGEGPLSAAESFVGITPAAKYVVQSPAQRMMENFLAARGHMHSTQAQREKRLTKQQLANEIKEGRVSGETMQSFIRSGMIGDRGAITDVLKRSFMTGQERMFERLTAEEALKVYAAMSPTEKKRFARLMLKKRRNARKPIAQPVQQQEGQL